MAGLPFASALRETLAEGYGRPELRRDLLAGLVTALVALPLSMALAIASGVPPQHGLATTVVAGAVAALAGGSRVLVSGPTAAFVALLLPVVLKFGLGGLLTAGLLSGAILVALGVARLGRAVEYVPLTVVTGFTSGVGLVIASLQVKDLLGLKLAEAQEHFPERLGALLKAVPSCRLPEALMGALTLALLLLFERRFRRLPAPLLALGLAALAAAGLAAWQPAWGVDTLGSRFQFQDASGLHPGIPRGLPGLRWPWDWSLPGATGPGLDLASLRILLPSAVAIALLGATESLLAAAVSDGMIRKRHDPDAELVAQGLANMAVPFFGGLPATGAIARTAAAVRYGARSPLAALTHALAVLLILLALAPLAAWLPMASLAALLLVVAWNMSEAHLFASILRVGRWGDRLVLLTCFSLTVLFDMTWGVTAGMLLAALVLLRRLEELTETGQLTPGKGLPQGLRLPPGAVVLQIKGSLLMGSAKRSLLPLAQAARGCSAVVLDLSHVRSMDISGLHALERFTEDLQAEAKQVKLAAAQTSVLELLSRSALFRHPQQGPPVFGSLEAAVAALEGPPGKKRRQQRKPA